MLEHSFPDVVLHGCCIVCGSFPLYQKDCLADIFLCAFIALAAAALHCNEGFRLSDTSTTTSFFRVTLSSSILPFHTVRLGIMLPYVHGLAISSIVGKKPVLGPICESVKVFLKPLCNQHLV